MKLYPAPRDLTYIAAREANKIQHKRRRAIGLYLYDNRRSTDSIAVYTTSKGQLLFGVAGTGNTAPQIVKHHTHKNPVTYATAQQSYSQTYSDRQQDYSTQVQQSQESEETEEKLDLEDQTETDIEQSKVDTEEESEQVYKPQNTRELSRIASRAAYKHPDKRVESIGPYVYNRGLSSTTLAVYTSLEGQALLGIRGTKITDTKDLRADWRILRNKNVFQTQRYLEAEKALTGLIDTYGAGNVNVTGHSLGGTIAAKLQERYTPNSDTYVFRPGVGPFGTLTENPNLYSEINRSDLISATGSTGVNNTYSNNSWKTSFDVAKGIATGNWLNTFKALSESHSIDTE
ncbi:hypothetical protein SARC_15856 [Sphaeroforma arctica JP610]|uniref:Fungal lipase-like domain-containing protein n=1 Tax=Sphaeroforma arctica JP610 TaxID=667725 RepID=A0A0L0F627_9EUKA|nr:hypothetical protein SARC_15856 [Sphaeroforma arctica JP610]KNC71603.1 hypothetical protein SARC_15856 [Sphaeroforma arctica JP610]|eukprot:XP_014145505.1 hypothetical protein SARC_15856 [Sphaeroforma arctica JP610]